MGEQEFRFTGEPGIYTVLAGEEVLDRVPVNAPLRESLLSPLAPAALADQLASGEPVFAQSPGQWRSRVFTRRRGQEVWRLLLGAALLLLVAESWVAASGGTASRTSLNPAADTGRAPVA